MKDNSEGWLVGIWVGNICIIILLGLILYSMHA